jgi:hypothetical protein
MIVPMQPARNTGSHFKMASISQMIPKLIRKAPFGQSVTERPRAACSCDITPPPHCGLYAADATVLAMRCEYPWGQGHWAQHGGPTVTWWRD